MPNMFHPFDARLDHRALASAALTATTTIGTIDQVAAMRTAYLTKVMLEAIKISANNEVYNLCIQVSSVSNFATFETAAILSLGPTETRIGGAPDSVAGAYYQLYWTTEVNEVVYQYARLRLVLGGTDPSITLAAHSTVMPGA
jgi:hypothetical protein